MIDLTPRPGAAPRSQAVWAHARTEAMLLLRNGEQLLLALVIPVAVLLGGRFLGARYGFEFDQVAPSVLGLAIFSSAFTSTAIATGFERRYGVLERLAATPLRRSGLVMGKAISVLLVMAGQLVLLVALALVLGWRPVAGASQWAVVLVTAVACTVAFVALALALAGTLRAELTLALANLLHLVVAAGGALLIGVERHPEPWGTIVAFTPSAALGEALRATSAHHVTLLSLPVALIWALGGVLLARKAFRWTS
ncbi:ABC transporter permease [Aestuariimicrobium ganziense]|uniref:ABC transporter permease n=1 Tax=Aestuariimicrobium ganziense TaxID=2773677 RepID=UPI001940BA54|nr:ABC transporter permease [Aestuariimicrobium ganziense]